MFTKIKEIFSTISAVLAVIGVIGGALIGVWGWTPASSQDLKEVDRSSAEVAADYFSNKKDTLTLLKGQIERAPENDFKEQQKQSVDNQIYYANKKLKEAEERLIELGR